MEATTHSSALLSELQAASKPEAKIEAIDVQETDVSKDPLEIGDIKPKTAIQKSEAVHSTAAGGEGYRLKVKGDYYALSPIGGKKMKLKYEVFANVPNLERAPSLLKNKLLDPIIKRKYPDAVKMRTFFIIEAKPRSAQTPETRNIKFMDHAQLAAHIDFIQAPIKVDLYSDVSVLRESVIDFTLNPKGFSEREAKRQLDLAETAELAAMNPELAE